MEDVYQFLQATISDMGALFATRVCMCVRARVCLCAVRACVFLCVCVCLATGVRMEGDFILEAKFVCFFLDCSVLLLVSEHWQCGSHALLLAGALMERETLSVNFHM